MAKYIVTGAAGFIGSNLVDKLLDLGHEVVGIDNLSSGLMENLSCAGERCNLVVADISVMSQLRPFYGLFEDTAGLYHTAAQARIQPTITNPQLAHDNNVTGMFNVLEMMRELNIKDIVFSSSSSIYGRKNMLPLTEGSPPDCLNPYSMSKYVGEQYIKTWCALYGLSGISLRYFNVFGPREVLQGQYAPIVGIFFRQLLSDKRPLTVIGDGEQKRDFTFIDDVVNANILAMSELSYRQFNGSVINIGSGVNYTINQVASMVLDSLDVDKDYISYLPERPAEARETLANITKARDELWWQPKYNLEKAIPLMAKYYQEKFGGK